MAISRTQPTAKEQRSAAPSVTVVAPGIGNNTLLAANANRLGAVVINNTGVPLYLKDGANASTVSYTRLVQPGEAFDLSFPVSVGQIDGYFIQAPSGYVIVTERA